MWFILGFLLGGTAATLLLVVVIGYKAVYDTEGMIADIRLIKRRSDEDF